MAMTTKAELRAHYRNLRDSIPPEERARMSGEIATRLFNTTEYNDAAAIACYYSVRSEVSTEEILRHALAHGKTVLLPRTETHGIALARIEGMENLVPGMHGIPEPPPTAHAAAAAEAELFIVPALAVDRAGNRLGYGPGHYDMLLQNIPAKKIALAFRGQVAARIPCEAHDIAMDMILTEEGIITCR